MHAFAFVGGGSTHSVVTNAQPAYEVPGHPLTFFWFTTAKSRRMKLLTSKRTPPPLEFSVTDTRAHTGAPQSTTISMGKKESQFGSSVDTKPKLCRLASNGNGHLDSSFSANHSGNSLM